MTDIWIYSDETGDRQLNSASASPYFGIGSASFIGESQAVRNLEDQIPWEAKRLGLKGDYFHATRDSPDKMIMKTFYDLIQTNAPRFDITIFHKTGVPKSVFDKTAAQKRRSAKKRAKQAEAEFLRIAWFLHFQRVLPAVARDYMTDKVTIIAGKIGRDDAAQEKAEKEGLEWACSVLARGNPRGDFVDFCSQDSRQSWGLQVADYGLWAAQRYLAGPCEWYTSAIEPNIAEIGAGEGIEGKIATPWGYPNSRFQLEC